MLHLSSLPFQRAELRPSGPQPCLVKKLGLTEVNSPRASFTAEELGCGPLIKAALHPSCSVRPSLCRSCFLLEPSRSGTLSASSSSSTDHPTCWVPFEKEVRLTAGLTGSGITEETSL